MYHVFFMLGGSMWDEREGGRLVAFFSGLAVAASSDPRT